MSERSSEDEFSESFFNIEEIIPNFCIDDVRRESLSFRENLLIFLKDEIANDKKPVGGYSISVEKIGPQGQEFLVHVVSSMKIDGFFGGSKVTGSITDKFHCLEEKRNEFNKDAGQENILFIGAQDNFYHTQTIQINGLKKTTQKNNLKFCCSENLLTEAANILLMRYLALTNFHGALQFKSLTIDGRIAISNYKCSAAQRMKYNQFDLEIYTIERRIHQENGSVQNIVTRMMKNGRILENDWTENSHILQINPLINLQDMESGEKPEKIPLRDSWHEDLELLSKFLDQKTCKMAQKAEYLGNHPELKNLIADYVQALLFVKPRDVLTFTIQHFLSFANESESKECEDIETEIFQIFQNFETKLKTYETNLSPELGSISTPKCPACSLCSSESSEISIILPEKMNFPESSCSEFSDYN